jgi:DNA-binding ferritin-like protein
MTGKYDHITSYEEYMKIRKLERGSSKRLTTEQKLEHLLDDVNNMTVAIYNDFYDTCVKEDEDYDYVSEYGDTVYLGETE